MKNTQIVTLRMPAELKARLGRPAKDQGVSVNQLANYMINTQVTQLEMLSVLEGRTRVKIYLKFEEKSEYHFAESPEQRSSGMG